MQIFTPATRKQPYSGVPPLIPPPNFFLAPKCTLKKTVSKIFRQIWHKGRENNPMCKRVLNIYKIWCRLPQYCNIHFDIYSGRPSAVHHRLFFFSFLITISLCQDSKIFQMCPYDNSNKNHINSTWDSQTLKSVWKELDHSCYCSISRFQINSLKINDS